MAEGCGVSYDLVDEIRLSEYTVYGAAAFTAYEKPDKEKWRYGDCPWCKKCFCVYLEERGRKRVTFRCTKCGVGWQAKRDCDDQKQKIIYRGEQ
jgi:hypothetical protein